MSVSLRQAIFRTQWVPPERPLATADPAPVLRQLLGYRHAGDIGKAFITDVSILQQVRRLRRPHFNVNVISIGFDDLPNQSEAEAEHRVDMALMRSRDIFDAVGIGIGRVLRFAVRAGPGRDNRIDSIQEFHDLTNAWTVHRDGIDAFMVSSVSIEEDFEEAGSAGISPQTGPCNKDDTTGATGIAVALQNDPVVMGDVLAHELCHYLGLHHDDSDGMNLMFPVRNGVHLTAEQATTMREHCMMRAPLRG
ncbi:MAG: hypothetical protein ABI862_04025 [Ilumatobacteraceae bacterium]